MMVECEYTKHNYNNDNEIETSLDTLDKETENSQISHPQLLWRNVEIRNTMIKMGMKMIPVLILSMKKNKHAETMNRQNIQMGLKFQTVKQI